MTPNARTCSRTNRPRQRPSSQNRQPSPLLVTSLGGTGIWSDSRSIQIGWKRALTLFYFLRYTDPQTTPLAGREQSLYIYGGTFLPRLDAPWVESRPAGILVLFGGGGDSLAPPVSEL